MYEINGLMAEGVSIMSRHTIGQLIFYGMLLCGQLLAGLRARPAHSQVLEWVRQLGGTIAEPENSQDVSADGLGNVYITGSGGIGPSITDTGIADAFLSKYDAAGSHQWTQRIESESLDAAYSVSADGTGNVYISGRTMGGYGDTQADAFLSKYNAEGALQWTRQSGFERYDTSWGVSADGIGNVYLVGETFRGLNEVDAFISKYDAEGAHQWTRQFGMERRQDTGIDVSADRLGNVFMSSVFYTSRAEGLLQKYDTEGNLQWEQQLGDGKSGVSTDGLGNVFTSSPFLRKFDAEGNLLWAKDVGGGGVSVDRLGNVYLSGHLSDAPDNQDEFISKYDVEGNLEWTTVSGLAVAGVSADGLGNVYASGSIVIKGMEVDCCPLVFDSGDSDPFLAKYIDCPDCEPPPIPPVVVNVALGGEIHPGSLVTHQFTTSFGDVPVTWSNLVAVRPTTNPATLSESGLFSWQTTKLDAGGLYQFDVTATNAGGSDTGRLTLRLAIIPEPTAIALLALGIGTSLFVPRARRRAGFSCETF
jgi:hypothetical protein